MKKMCPNTKYLLILLICSYFLFMFGNGIVSLTNPDEVFYSQIAKEMAQHSTWTVPYLFDQPNFEKPICLYWLLRLGFILFGTSNFAARFFPALLATVGVVAVYYLGLLGLGNSRKAFYAALILMSSGLYIGLARSVFTDMVFSVLILLALLAFFWGYQISQRKNLSILLFFASSALAVLTKGPLGLIMPFSAVFLFLWLRRDLKYLRCRYSVWGAFIFMIIALPWYINMFTKYGQVFTHEFFYYDHLRRLVEAEHKVNDNWYFYPIAMLAGMFPWSVFIAAGLFYALRYMSRADASNLFLICWIASTLFIFQFAHSKLISYIFPMFPALAIVGGNYIFESMPDKIRQRQFLICSALTWVISLFIVSGVVVFGLKSYYFASLRPAYFLISVLCLWLIITGVYLLKNRYFRVFQLFFYFLPIFMLVVPLINRDIEPYISSRRACEFLLNNCAPDKGAQLLCSKNFTRGTRFYTDMKVAVLFEENFFSPHPVPFLNSDDKVKEFLLQQPFTYGFLKKSALKRLQEVAGDQFEFQVASHIGNQYIVKIQQK